ncbi:MAG: hypothetical protein LUD79_02840 [Oscillospiraceae bacterium]|nr:hypothetical protein [Oscillospiraceae bacterium]
MTLTEVRQSLIDYLNLQGVHALGAWAGDARLTHPAGVAVVGLKSLSCAPWGIRTIWASGMWRNRTPCAPYTSDGWSWFSVWICTPPWGSRRCV